MKKRHTLRNTSRSDHDKQHRGMETFTRNHHHNADKLTFRKLLVIEAFVDYHLVCMVLCNIDVVISQLQK